MQDAFYEIGYDASAFDSIPVPSVWQNHGYDHHQYTNIRYPFPADPPYVPKENPCGAYLYDFTYQKDAAAPRAFLNFEGVASCLYVWLNGQFVGYSQVAHSTSEFDVTKFLQDGANHLAVLVLKWCDGSYMEDQDMFRMNGIFRDVYLLHRPEQCIEDYFITTDIHGSTAGVAVRLRYYDSAVATRITLYDAAGTMVGSVTPVEAPDDAAFPYHAEITIVDPTLWNAEQPYLYTLVLDTPNETITDRVGIREVHVANNQIYVNGQSIKFHGVNRHESDPVTGYAVGFEQTKKDLLMIKKHNFNAIRTSHYQNQDALYDLCDEYGLYLIAENNLESHGTWDIHQAGIRGIEGVLPNDKPEWKAVLFDRINSTYQRDKNHPAVLIWSLGNESFGGETLLQMAEMVRRFDDTRLVHYEGVVNDPRFLETTDIESHMYSTVKDIKEYLAQGDKRPYIECEYSHAMGNSNGALHKYTELADQKDCGYQGGFIWDYIDQSIWKKDRYGKWFQAYGGDFGERPTDYNFSGNGIAYGGDRAPSPKMQEVKFCYQNIAISIDNSGFEVWNKNLFTSTDAFDCVALLHRDGKLYQQQELTNIDVAPEERSSFPLPFMVPALPGEYAVTISFRLKEDTSWAKKGHEVAFGQGVIAVVRSIPSKKVTPFTVTHGTHNIGVRGENFDVLFSDLNGGLTSYRYAGKEMIQEIPRPNFWRAPTDNDCGNNMGGVRGQWKLASLYATTKGIGKEIPSVHGGAILQNPTCEVEADSVVVTYLYNLQTSPAAECSLQYRVFGDGRIQTTLHYDPVEGLAAMPEFGVLFKIDADYDTVEWYGNGPAETYWDRQHGAKLGIYQNKVADNMAQYLVPQECGAKTAVRWAKVVDRKGRGLLFTADAAKPMFFSALPYTPHEMESAKHPYELPPVHYTVIRAIGEQMGVGGDDSWGANVHPEYIPDVTKPVEFTFTFRGI